MREILFRGKKENDGKWIYGAVIPDLAEALKHKYPYPLGIGFIKPIEANENGKRYMQAVERETVGQFTGLLDVNGKKIFEGDIVHGNLPDLSYEPDRTGVAKWGDFGWIVEFNVPEWKMPRIGFCSFGDVEIIGNIYDNPELLEAEA